MISAGGMFDSVKQVRAPKIGEPVLVSNFKQGASLLHSMMLTISSTGPHQLCSLLCPLPITTAESNYKGNTDKSSHIFLLERCQMEQYKLMVRILQQQRHVQKHTHTTYHTQRSHTHRTCMGTGTAQHLVTSSLDQE